MSPPRNVPAPARKGLARSAQLNPQSALVADHAADIATPGSPSQGAASREAAAERLDARGIIGQAKLLLMTRRGMSEPEAYRWIQKSAMDRRLSMLTVANRILDGSESAPEPAPAALTTVDTPTGTDSAVGDNLGE
jgi:hypothetical protein